MTGISSFWASRLQRMVASPSLLHGRNDEEGSWWLPEASVPMTMILSVCSDGQNLIIG